MKKLLVFILFVLLYTTTVWAQDDVGSLISPGHLSKAHEKYEGITNCTKCHALGGGIPDSKCLDCHDKLAEKIKKRVSIQAYQGTVSPAMKTNIPDSLVRTATAATNLQDGRI